MEENPKLYIFYLKYIACKSSKFLFPPVSTVLFCNIALTCKSDLDFLFISSITFYKNSIIFESCNDVIQSSLVVLNLPCQKVLAYLIKNTLKFLQKVNIFHTFTCNLKTLYNMHLPRCTKHLGITLQTFYLWFSKMYSILRFLPLT